MCMISGYIGDAEAAPTLLEMTKRQEFVFGGFYTGIATAHDGRLHRKRTVGAASQFCSQNLESDLPGSIGIAHSRTNDGGGIEWAQPRLDEDEVVATVGVGIGGVLASPEKTQTLAENLSQDGAIFKTRIDGAKKNGIVLSDGGVVHGGEVSLIALGRLYRNHVSIPRGIRELDIRSESVDLVLTANEPDRLFVVNHNSRLLVASTPFATIVSSSRLGIIDAPVWTMEIPPNTIATITRQDVTCEPLWTDESLFDFTIPGELPGQVIEFLESQPGSPWFEVIQKAIEPSFSKNKATLAFPIGHQVIEELLNAGRLRFEVQEVAGVEGQFPVPQMVLFRR